MDNQKLQPKNVGASDATAHLLRDPANAERLRRSIAEAEAGRLVEHDLVAAGKFPVKSRKIPC